MSLFLCDHCEKEYPAGTPGTSFLVLSDGRTRRFDSNACLRAFANDDARSIWESAKFTVALCFSAFGFILGGLTAFFLK